MMRKNTILILFFACTCFKVQAQTIVCNYNTHGGCTSRVYSSKSSQKARSAQKSTTDSKLINFDVSPSPIFNDQIVISATGLPSSPDLVYVMANLSGQVIYKGSLEKGTVTLSTSTLQKGIYFLKISGEDVEQTYKLTKN